MFECIGVLVRTRFKSIGGFLGFFIVLLTIDDYLCRKIPQTDIIDNQNVCIHFQVIFTTLRGV